jgi:tetratricopeptide (TPR) repeat protein
LRLVLIVAIACCLRGEPIHVKSALAAISAAKSEIENQHFERAADFCRKAVEIEPTFIEAHECLIGAYLKSNQRLEAAAAITRFLEIEPELRRYRLILAQILFEGKQFERALAQFSLVLRSDPFDADALLGLASASSQLGMGDRAAQALERGRKRYPLDSRFKP